MPLRAIVTSPLRRCRQTAQALVDRAVRRLSCVPWSRAWSNAATASGPASRCASSARTSSGARAAPALGRAVSRRGVDVGDGHASDRAPSVPGTARFEAEHGSDAVWAAVSHGDLIKAILADALGMHLDSFQRIVVDPASISIVRYTAARPYVITVNSTDGRSGRASCRAAAKRRAPAAEAAGRRPVGGGLGAADAGRDVASSASTPPECFRSTIARLTYPVRMAILVHRYDAPDRFVAGTVGQPGERTFFLQAREGNRITSVACEKQQVSVLAEHLDRVLDEVLRRSAGEVDVPPASTKARDTDPLDAPITEEFRVGTMTIAWDPSIDRIVIELFSNVDVEEEEPARSRPAPDRRGVRRDRRRRGVRGQDHRLVRARLRGPRPGPGRRRPTTVSVLPAAAGPAAGTSARGPTATAARCSTDSALTADDLGRLSEDGRRSAATSRPDAPSSAQASCRSPAGCSRRRTPPSWPSCRRTADPSSASTSRSRGSGRCGTSRTAPSVSGRWPRTRSPGSAGSTACRSPCWPTGHSGPGRCRSGSTSTRRRPTSSSIWCPSSDVPEHGWFPCRGRT